MQIVLDPYNYLSHDLVPAAADLVETAAPELEYRPRDPRRYHPPIGLIGCGSISEYHLAAYRRAGYNVVALCDLVESRARARQIEFYPEARVYTDYRDLLRRDEIEVVDIATVNGPVCIHGQLTLKGMDRRPRFPGRAGATAVAGQHAASWCHAGLRSESARTPRGHFRSHRRWARPMSLVYSLSSLRLV